ncbi:hypothetical protein IRJ41_021837, partial [Triplophysa rosa]
SSNQFVQLHQNKKRKLHTIFRTQVTVNDRKDRGNKVQIEWLESWIHFRRTTQPAFTSRTEELQTRRTFY